MTLFHIVFSDGPRPMLYTEDAPHMVEAIEQACANFARDTQTPVRQAKYHLTIATERDLRDPARPAQQHMAPARGPARPKE